MTRAEVEREGVRLPPILRRQFESPPGRKELALSLVDKRLLFAEAVRRGLDKDEAVQRQVRELNERLTVQALLQAEEKSSVPATEAEERAWFEAHKAELAIPLRVRVRRFLARSASAGEREKARARAKRVLARARAGEPFEALAAAGDGKEKSQGGDLGVQARGDLGDAVLEAAAFALEKPGELSPLVEERDGVAVLQLVEKLPASLPSFADARAAVQQKLQPLRKRRAFDDLRDRLRKESLVKIDEGALR